MLLCCEVCWVLDKPGLFFQAGVFGGERLFVQRGGLRLPLAGLAGKQFPAAVLDGGKRGHGRVEGGICGCHNSTLLQFRVSLKGLRAFFCKINSHLACITTKCGIC